MTTDLCSDTCLTHRISSAARDAEVIFVDSAGNHSAVSSGQVFDAARHVAGNLQRVGVVTGDACAVAGQPDLWTVATIFGCWLAGASVAVMPIDRGVQPADSHAKAIMAKCESAGVKVLVLGTEGKDLRELIEKSGGVEGNLRIVEATELSTPIAPRVVACDPERIAILQFTSGTTSASKIAQVSQRAITNSVDAMARKAQVVRSDVFVSWLPLYHDMGLVGFLITPLLRGATVVIASPSTFARSPLRWARWVGTFGGTVTAGPVSSYALLARSLTRGKSQEDLSSCRIALYGAEPVSPDAVRSFIAASAAHGFRGSAVFCAYGLAEATLGVTFAEPGEGLRTDVPAESGVRWEGAHEHALNRELARLGTPLDSVRVRIVAESKGDLPDRTVGAIEVSGEVLMSGYSAGVRRVPSDWVDTGDLGYWVDGELVVCGRTKDVVIVGGRNLNAEALEDAVARALSEYSRGLCATSVQTRTGERLALIVEGRTGEAKEIRRRAQESLRTEFGLTGADVIVVRPRSLPRTSSGKIRRSMTRDLLLADELVP